VPKGSEQKVKIASYVTDGLPSFGVVTGSGIVSMSRRLQGRYETLRDVLVAGALDEILLAMEDAKPDHDISDVTFLPAVPNPGKILCTGINYSSHASEMGRDISQKPSLFIRFTDTLVGHEGALIKPSVSESFDFEGELAVIIGRGGYRINAEEALSHVAGYTCFIDGSVRDYQKFSVTSGKNFPGTGPLGPWIVTNDEIPDPSRLELTTRLNGSTVQHARTDLLIHSVPDIIAFCSSFTALAPGDVIATGTPDGVGQQRTPPLWMKAGDVLEVEISGIGTLRNRVVDEC
jgi:2-keto-4-pentenoate hydratase/2-oxohepta-3-ene-1,7-dioic acid hydratase in catechol pathway